MFCHCGTMAGYPHDFLCPFPLFTGVEPDPTWVEGWNERALEKAYGGERHEPCKHGHFDCAVVEGGACANETFAKLAINTVLVEDHTV